MKALLLLAAVVGGAHAGCTVEAAYGTPATPIATQCTLKAPYVILTSSVMVSSTIFTAGAVCQPANSATLHLGCATGFAPASHTPTLGTCAADGSDWGAVAGTSNFIPAPTAGDARSLLCNPACTLSVKYCNNSMPLPGYVLTLGTGTTGSNISFCSVNNTQKVTVSCAPGWVAAAPTTQNTSSSTCTAAATGVVPGAWSTTFPSIDLNAGATGGVTCVAVPAPPNTTNATNGTNATNSSNTTPAAPPGSAPVPAGSSAVVQSTANAVAALGPNPPITSVINVLNNLPANTSSADFVSSTNVALATAYPTTGTALTAAQGTTFFEALPSTLTSNNRAITFTTSQINLIFQQIGISSRGQTAAVVANRGQCVSGCVALAQLTGIRLFSKICATNACAGLRQVNGLPAVSCSGTAQQQRDCWKNAACAGQLNGVANCTVQNVAERCPSCDKSKKGLLGLLGLLGIIPLVLSSLLLSLLLLCIRRKKTAGAVQFATYDAGAQNVCVPGAPGFGPGYPATCL